MYLNSCLRLTIFPFLLQGDPGEVVGLLAPGVLKGEKGFPGQPGLPVSKNDVGIAVSFN